MGVKPERLVDWHGWNVAPPVQPIVAAAVDLQQQPGGRHPLPPAPLAGWAATMG
jgi:hypothetical protein